MIRLLLILFYLTVMMLASLFFAYEGWRQGDVVFLLLGLTLPLWLKLLGVYAGLMNRIEVGPDLFVLRNPFRGKHIYHYRDIEQWELSRSLWVIQKSLMIRINGKKLLISDMRDKKNFEKLVKQLRNIRADAER